MASNQLHLPHDKRIATAALAAIVVLAALIIFLMLTLARAAY